MPELPEIEVLRRSLEPHLPGDVIERVEVRNAALRERVRGGELKRLAGRGIRELRRRAKYLLVDLEGGRTVAIHLGMSGRLTLVPAAEPREPHEHVAFYLRSGRRLRLRDPRRFGLVLALPTATLAQDPHFARLGAEPLEEGFAGETLRRAVHSGGGRRGPVKPFLMDASVVVGLGNIYATEALFGAGVHPARSVSRISPAGWRRLAGSAVTVLRRAIAQGGTTLNDFSDGEGRSGYFQVSLGVYGRQGEPCPRCGRPIRRIVQAGRSTFYCPRCQR
ncbi:MAG TPA: bifunctional DNA-formamidopyrimidine glycosylase/DNA-(apurinic or apyrimidinic site) lyase [Thermoanaerobaculia bacterium]|nr:bifunctional DNA-formamidopyrimidine glycosylase/DNA-(apurinic or apyrimidinic site) lyase [Thermoanaerobaculia bacterium]